MLNISRNSLFVAAGVVLIMPVGAALADTSVAVLDFLSKLTR